MYQEVIRNLESIQGALLRMNRSIQAEGTFGIMKNRPVVQKNESKNSRTISKTTEFMGRRESML